jgi:hypothetical protein
MRRIVGWLFLVVALGLAAIAVVAVLARFGDGPLGPLPGGPFRANAEDPSSLDRALAAKANTIEIEVGKAKPRTRTTWIVADDGTLYVPAGGAEYKTWPKEAEADGAMRIRIGGHVFALKATRVTDPALHAKLIKTVSNKYGDGTGDPNGAMAQSTWFFRLDPETPGSVASPQG